MRLPSYVGRKDNLITRSIEWIVLDVMERGLGYGLGPSWRATMDLTPGAHQVIAAALHPSTIFTAYATNNFTNNAASDLVTTKIDGNGNVTNRVWTSGGVTNLTQSLYYDALGRLWKTIERDSTQSGYNRTAVYDGLSRLLHTTEVPVANN